MFGGVQLLLLFATHLCGRNGRDTSSEKQCLEFSEASSDMFGMFRVNGVALEHVREHMFGMFG